MWVALVIGIGLLLWSRRTFAASADAIPLDNPVTVVPYFPQADMSTFDPNPPDYSQPIKDLAQAIATAEGFQHADAVPARANNPGDLKVPGWTGPVTGAENIPVFTTVDEGWNRLYHQLWLIDQGRSRVYDRTMTFDRFGQIWTDTDQPAWTSNVVTALQNAGYPVDSSSSLADVFDTGAV